MLSQSIHKMGEWPGRPARHCLLASRDEEYSTTLLGIRASDSSRSHAPGGFREPKRRSTSKSSAPEMPWRLHRTPEAEG